MIEEEISKRNDSFERYRERLTNFSSEFEIGLFLYLTRQIWVWMLLIVIVCFGLGFLYIRYTPPQYKAKALIQRTSQDNARRILNVKNPLQEDETLTGDVELLRSPLLMEKTVASLPLQIRYFLEGKILKHEKYNGSLFLVEDFQLLNSSLVNVPIYVLLKPDKTIHLKYTVDEETFEFNESLNESFSTEHFICSIQISDLNRFYAQQNDGEFYFLYSDLEKLASEFSAMLEVSIANSNANTIGLSFTHPNQVLTKDVLGALIENFDQFDSIKRSESSNRIVEFIAMQKDSVSKKLKESERMLKDFKDTNKIRQVEGMTDSYLSRIEEMESELVKLDVDEQILNEIATIITDNPLELDIYNVLPILIGSEFESNLYTLISVLHKKLMLYEDLISERTADHEEIKKIRSQIDVQIKLISEGIKSLLNKTMTRKETLTGKLNKIESKFYNLPEKELEYGRLDRIFNIRSEEHTSELQSQIAISV